MFLGRRKWTRVLLLVAAAATFILYQRSTSSHIAVSEPGVRLGDPVPVVRRDRDLPPHEDREEPSHQQHRANTEEESRLKVERKVNGWDWSDDPLLVKSPLGDKLGPDVSPTRMHGTIGVRPDGTPGWTVTEWPTDHVETMEEKHEHHAHNCFNLARSDSITLDRDIPDARAPECRQQSYPTDLPQTSVVFVFYNEPLSPLFRSIHSVLNRSPPHLLKEIILVDDGSDAEWTQGPLEAYIKLLPKVLLRRMPVRQGLMATREEGARVATAETVTFLDSHIEVNEGWLEPLLARVRQDRRHVVMPAIDSIDPDNFGYHAGGLDILGFSWSLGQKGMARVRSRHEPMKSPVMAGGLFTMDRSLFFELGGYDPEMKLYGGEEMEISFRLWMCGNTLECIPCSRVGHVFRTGRYWKGQVYPVPGSVIIKNKLRASYMWLDEYAYIANNVMGDLPPPMEIGNLSWGANIRNHCLNGQRSHPFSWFLKNVYPEMTDVMGIARETGEIKNAETHGCVDTLGNHNNGGTVGLYPCHGSHGTQEFLFGKDGQIRIALADFVKCLQSSKGNGDVAVPTAVRCAVQENPSKGFDLTAANQLKEKASGLCLAASRNKGAQSPISLRFAECDASDPLQTWEFNANIKQRAVKPL
eukprot:m.538231 g.538231  ORF g.538231 m.538231 type:complete len:641 (-) comp22080_c0_seq5:548-2470(-)